MSLLDARGHEVNGNGASLTERQMKKQMAMNATIGDVNEIAAAHASKAMNHLGNQIPGFVQKMVADAIQGFYESLKERGMLLEPKALDTNEPANTGEYPPIVHSVDHSIEHERRDTPPTDSEGGE